MQRKNELPYRGLGSIGACVREARTKRGLTQQALAKKSGLHPLDISRWERDYAVPHICGLVALSKGLGITITELIGY